MDRESIRAIPLTLALVAAAAAIAGIALLLGLGDRDSGKVAVAEIAEGARSVGNEESGDPLAWSERRSGDLAARATLGTSHVIYAKSPGGVMASAARTAAWRKQVEAAAEPAGVNPDTLEAIVFLESAGRPEVMADGTPNSASGLAQIIPSTATEFLGMEVDLPASIALTKDISKAISKGKEAKAKRLATKRRALDERFDPQRALEGAARYIQIATERFGSEELAVVSYHMGIGNLESVIAAYTAQETGGDGVTAALVDAARIDYPRLFFDTSPTDHEEAWRILDGFGDDSSLYLWRVRASRGIMAGWRDNPDALEAEVELATQKATLEETYHPEGETEVFAEPGDIEKATVAGELVRIPAEPSLGFKVTKQAGEMAPKLDADPELYRVLRPEALAALIYLSAKVQAISGEATPLQVTSASRDQKYQDLLVGVNPEATAEYSLHTTGWSFDIRRNYASNKQAAAFQFALDRLRAHAIIDYAYEPGAIHITVSENAELLLD
jgi:hypothetical protein